MTNDAALLEALPVAIYTTDAEGRLTSFNEAAAQLWGRRPVLGSEKWCGALRLYLPDGSPLPHDRSALALSLREGRNFPGLEAICERPDGTRLSFLTYPTLLRDEQGQVTGAINLLIDATDRRQAEIDSARLAAIVSSSDDAIVSKSLDGIVTSWNAGAARIFGYSAEEMIGQPIFRIIPDELRAEEKQIIARLQAGERVDHFDTVRIAKDGRRVDVSLTISPLRDKTGKVVGASKIARDVTERKQSEALQRLLFDELNHRVKNTLASIQAIASQSLRRAASPAEFVSSFNGRIQALARAHDLLVEGRMTGADIMSILREQVLFGGSDGERIICAGPFLKLEPKAAVQLALVLHELSTNARKYGALSSLDCTIDIGWRTQQEPAPTLLLEWHEHGVPNVAPPSSRGFGMTMIERSLEANGGGATVTYGPDGLLWRIRMPLPKEDPFDRAIVVPPGLELDRVGLPPRPAPPGLAGRRIMVIEDEPLLAMDIEAALEELGCVVVGPAGNLAAARRLVADGVVDAALLDANLGGKPVDELAEALAAKGIPFIFATGYERGELPARFASIPILAKPFSPEQLGRRLEMLLGVGVSRAFEMGK